MKDTKNRLLYKNLIYYSCKNFIKSFPSNIFFFVFAIAVKP